MSDINRRSYMHVRIQRGGDRVSLKNHKNVEFTSNTGPDPLKITKLPSQHSCWAIMGMPAKHHFNGVSLAGQWWPAYSGIWNLPSLINFKKRKRNVKVGPPLTKLSGSVHDMSAHVLLNVLNWVGEKRLNARLAEHKPRILSLLQSV